MREVMTAEKTGSNNKNRQRFLVQFYKNIEKVRKESELKREMKESKNEYV